MERWKSQGGRWMRARRKRVGRRGGRGGFMPGEAFSSVAVWAGQGRDEVVVMVCDVEMPDR